VWTPEELAANLRSCVQLLAPSVVDVELEEPMKHGQCGSAAPLVLRSIGGTEKIEFSPAPTMNCRLAASLGEWAEKVLQPIAQQALGARIKRIVGSSSYSCRNIYNNPKLTLSEHATGNAIDIAGFVTTDGRTIMVARGWGPTGRDIEAAKKKASEKAVKKDAGAPADEAGGKGKDSDGSKDGEKAEDKSPNTAAANKRPSEGETGKKASAKAKGPLVKANFKNGGAEGQSSKLVPTTPATNKEAAFLKRLHGSSCSVFSTVLGPEANDAHRDHFHLDMKVRRSGVRVCH
jgi:hypothetical protein